jgi:hypothetical protein
MGAITRSIANNITTSGVFTSSAIANSSVTGITVLPNAEDGITFISSQTASNSASISFTSGLTSTYKAYKFVFSNIYPRTDIKFFSFQASTNGGSTYATTLTSTFFYNINSESGSKYFAYETGFDKAQSTTFQELSDNIGSDADQSLCGSLLLFNPSSTTYVKHFISTTSAYTHDNTETNSYIAGYFNTTSAINAIQFKLRDSANFDGTIYLYGIK